MEKENLQFIVENWGSLLSGLMAFIWIIVRLTPTKKDDVVFGIIKKILDLFIPDRKRGGGRHVKK